MREPSAMTAYVGDQSEPGGYRLQPPFLGFLVLLEATVMKGDEGNELGCRTSQMHTIPWRAVPATTCASEPPPLARLYIAPDCPEGS